MEEDHSKNEENWHFLAKLLHHAFQGTLSTMGA